MSWFFANPTSFDNGSSETILNSPINLALISMAPSKVMHTPVGTSESLFSISFVVDTPSVTLYTHYPDETARDNDFALLSTQIQEGSTTGAGWFSASSSSFANGDGVTITNNDVNLDVVASFKGVESRPLATRLLLPAIRFEITNRASAQYLYYANTAARDADLALINTATGNVGVNENPYTQSGETTDATETTLSGSRSVTEDSVLSFVTRVTAIEPATGDTWAYEFKGVVKNLAGTTALVDTVWSEELAEDTGATNWTVSIEANDGTDALDIKVTGEASHTIKWKAVTTFDEITF